MKEFVTTGLCNPDKHYMVNIDERLREMKKMIDHGDYITMNRARQYGKTTTLSALRKFLIPKYEVVSMSFQGIGNAAFQTEDTFVQSLCRLLLKEKATGVVFPSDIEAHFNEMIKRRDLLSKLDELFDIFSEWCTISDKPIVLMIDEVDSSTNNQVFLDFLGMLRDMYLNREDKVLPAFQSVILAGVTDVKHLKRKLRPEDMHRFNSPWNIASDFTLDMSLSTDGIKGMLDEYEADHHTGMDTLMVAREIRHYTEGYPFLVSRICLLIDKYLSGKNERFSDLSEAWSIAGVSEAVRLILMEKNTLFDSLMGKVYDNKALQDILQNILFGGERIPYNPDYIPAMDGEMYGFIKNEDGALAIANSIFETRLYNYFLSISELSERPISKAGSAKRDRILTDGYLDMELLLEIYVEVFGDIYGDSLSRFDEEEGRRRFLLFLRPIINGTGNYYVEARTRNNERMDLVIDYLGKRYVIELKIWRGQAYHEKGELQLARYLESYHLDKGYMLIYNFNQSKISGMKHVTIMDKTLVEAVV